MKRFSFDSRLRVQRPIVEVFEFFSNASNLEEITPPWLQFHVTSKRPIEMRRGTEIQYRLKIRGIPVRWSSRITVWDPPHRFIDEQIRGPYREWVHEHRFAPDSGGTVCEDHVQYAVFGGALINRLFVAGDVRRIFEYRSSALQSIFVSAK